MVHTDTSQSWRCALDTSELSLRLPPPFFTLCFHSLSCCNIFNMATWVAPTLLRRTADLSKSWRKVHAASYHCERSFHTPARCGLRCQTAVTESSVYESLRSLTNKQLEFSATRILRFESWLDLCAWVFICWPDFTMTVPPCRHSYEIPNTLNKTENSVDIKVRIKEGQKRKKKLSFRMVFNDGH